MNKQYIINEIFYSIQGEGIRTGTVNFFLRFTGCNMQCSIKEGMLSPGGFDCDTEFTSGRKMTLDEIRIFMLEYNKDCKWIILTGGEPALQLDSDLISYFHNYNFKLAIETNGSIELPQGLDWITVSPKVAEHAIRQKKADEVKYVRGYGQAIPKTAVEANYYLISPAFDGSELDNKTLSWCIQLVKENPKWGLSVQQHKYWKVR